MCEVKTCKERILLQRVVGVRGERIEKDDRV
jgi:hypothetical protein